MSGALQVDTSARPWIDTTLGELADYVTSGSRDWSQYYAASGALFIRTQDIAQNRLCLDNVPRVALPEKVEGKRSRLKRGDLLITITGNVGRVAVVDTDLPEAYVSQSVCLVRLKNPSVAAYVRHQLLTKKGGKTSLEAMGYGLGRAVLNLENIRSAPIRLAPSLERKAIVSEIEKQVSRVDETVSNLRRIELSLRRYRQSLIAAAFPRPGASLSAGWYWQRLPNLGDLARGKSKHRPRNDPKLYGGPYPFIQTAEVRASGGRIRGYTQTYSELGLAQSRLWPKGTLCITIAANIAETGILEFDACFPDSVVGLRIEGNPTLVKYVELYLRSVKDRLHRLAPATAQKNINLEILKKLDIPVPPDDLVERVVSTIEKGLSIADQVNVEVAASFVRANRLKEAQLIKAFSPR